MEHGRIVGWKLLLYSLFPSVLPSCCPSQVSISFLIYMGPFNRPTVFLIIILPKLSLLAHLPNIRTLATLPGTHSPAVTDSDLVCCELGFHGHLPHRNLKLHVLKAPTGYLSPPALLPPVHPMLVKDTIIL